jgi:hypothetical protein
VPATPRARVDALVVALLAYAAASLIHFSHNAIFADAYPNLPASLTPLRICVAWLAEAAIGFAGYLLIRAGARRTGLALVALYATLAFDGLAHYSLAPISAHTAAMNLTIWAEVAAGSILLGITGVRLFHLLLGRERAPAS